MCSVDCIRHKRRFSKSTARKMITSPGIYQLSADQYHMDPCPEPSLSSGIANILIGQSPAHAWVAHPRLNVNYQREVDSRFDLGSAAHTLLLEKNRSDRIVVVDAKDWRTNAAKEAREAATAAGKFAVLIEQYDEVCLMAHSAREFIDTTELRGLFQDGAAEQTVVWQEDETWFRCRPDWLTQDRRIVVDYKTTENASPEVFARQISRMGYDLQAEFYTRGVRTVAEDKEPQFVFLVQEISYPYICSLIALSNTYRLVGFHKMKKAIALWQTCMAKKAWPAYSEKIAYVEAKPWDLANVETDKIIEEVRNGTL